MTAHASDPEELIEKYIQANQKDKAVALLYQLAVKSAKNRDFVQSEAYRDRLYEIDSMALSRIIEVNELIEAEKSRTLTPNHRQMWAAFFKELSKEEANAFFFSLVEQKLESEQIVIEQGQPNDRLYLVNQGQLKVLYSDNAKEVLIHQLGSGDIFGERTFFSVNVCTVSVKTLTQVRLSYLERSRLDNLKKTYNFLDGSLEKVCCSGLSLYDRLRRKGFDRRAFKRINFQTKVSVQLLTSDTQKRMRRPLTAELWDISKGGLSFYMQSKNKEAVRRLTGRTLGVRFNLMLGAKNKEVAVTGMVHGVESHPLDEYSVHMKLNRNFSDSAIKTIYHIASTR